MSGIYNYTIVKELNLIILVLQNELTIDRLKVMRQEIANDKDFNSDCILLIDIRLAKINISIKEIRSFGEWFRRASTMKSSNRKVFLTSSPNQVVKSFVFTTISYISSFKIFSTTKGCLDFLEIDISNSKLVDDEIKKMIVK